MTWGNAYNAQCWAEARSLALEFLERAARKHTVIRPASEAMKKVAIPLRRIAELFPFTGKFETEPVADQRAIAETVALLEEARSAEARVIEALRGAIEAGF